MGIPLRVGVSLLTVIGIVAAGDEAPSSTLRVTETAEGFLFTDDGKRVLFYRRTPRSLGGRFTRSHYVHPLRGLAGEVLTEDFPEDHPHHRGIFWGWHQIRLGDRPVGDSWALRDFSWDVREVRVLEPENGAAGLEARVLWKSPLFTDAAGEEKPLVEETLRLRVHPVRDGVRGVDFDIRLRALVDDVRIGGSRDRKGYGGFSPRIRLPEDAVFTGRGGAVEPRNLAVEAGPWIDISGSLGGEGTRAGVTVLPHPSTPDFPRQWILRRRGSTQNHAYPGREAIPLSRREPLTLRYRLLLHGGDLGRDRIEALFRQYGGLPEVAPLPGTRPLEWIEPDLSDRLMKGAHRFVERQIDESIGKRQRPGSPDRSSSEARERSLSANRQRLRRIIGAVDDRLPPRLEVFGDDENPALVAETKNYTVHRARWPVVDGVFGEGLRLRPGGTPVGRIVAIPDADQTPEELLGLADGVAPESQFARHLAEYGFEVIVPALISRQKLATDDSRLRGSDQTHREWIYRQAYQMGRHIIGYEVQIVLAAVDGLERRSPGRPIGVAGYGEGGLVALHAAALDRRIDAALVSGYFDSRQGVWSEPIYRNVWGLLREFGDAEVAALIAPRRLVIEYSPVPPVRGHKGDLATPPLERVRAELERLPAGPGPRPELIHGPRGEPVPPGSAPALAALARGLGVDTPPQVTGEMPRERRSSPEPGERQRRLLRQLENHVQGLVRRSEHVRDRFFLHRVMPELASRRWSTDKRLPVQSPEKFIEAAREYRRLFHEEAMGRFDEPLLPPNPRTRKIRETERWIAYDVVLDVWKEVFAWGVLVLPRGMKAGERRPVVVCQHGRNGVPRDTIDGNRTAYNNFAAALAERGFITFAPHNLYRGEDRYRWLDRKANGLGASLFTFIIAQHRQILDWLETLPFVDGERIAFYGLSYGGETAMRVPAILEKYCLSICSGDFNQWTRKVAATDQPFSFMNTIEWEMPYWNLGQTFDYAEMAYLIFPRPFMVERGHLDRVGRDRWVAHEYAKVRWLYAQFGLAHRTEIEYFQGGHSIHGERTFDFLHHHLRWPKPGPIREGRTP